MNPYGGFALTYDRMMQDVPYDQWVEFIEALFRHYQITPKIVLDLGCGTGSITKLLAKKNYEMIGVDLSQEMLMVAKKKIKDSHLDVLFLCQDMTELDLYGTVGAVLSVCDSLNYLLTEEELLEAFKKVNNFLDPEGLFIFDINTDEKFKQLGDQTYAESFEDCAYIWDNYYDEEDQTNEYYLTLFVEEKDIYRRYEEIHYERAYDIETITKIIEQAGLRLEGVYDGYSFEQPKATSERLCFVAREYQK